MNNQENHSMPLITSAAIGTLLGGIAALLVAPTTGQQLRKGVCQACASFSHTTQELTNRGKSLANRLTCRTCETEESPTSSLCQMLMKAFSPRKEETTCQTHLLIGGAVGITVGCLIGLLIAPKSGQELRHDLCDVCGEISKRTGEMAHDVKESGLAAADLIGAKAHEWLNTTRQVVEELSGNIQGKQGAWREVKQLLNHQRIDDVIDWATLGVSLWKRLSHSR